MTKSKKTQTFTVRHDSGATWVIACNAKQGIEHMNTLAHRFMQNGMARKGLRGTCVATNDSTGEEVIAINHA